VEKNQQVKSAELGEKGEKALKPQKRRGPVTLIKEIQSG